MIILATSFEKMLQGGSSADIVAKVVLKAATSENPSPRETWMEAKRSMSDELFHEMNHVLFFTPLETSVRNSITNQMQQKLTKHENEIKIKLPVVKKLIKAEIQK